jgi:hypothetical protein
LRLLEAAGHIVKLCHPCGALRNFNDGNCLNDLFNVLCAWSTEIRLLGIVEETLIEGHITRKDHSRLGWNPNEKDVRGIVANPIANESASEQLLLP